ncbi:hypothetical protein L596_026104 [Steinernema carpocapsae]|uniref:Uncharacterized protein n=1 Tax=Steinernema carpocapsae TaxID=34508 RepID=A0A4U5M0D4_STECR|nr:hypothetical protein L596_026104 [Steinernema carpocapsae]
MNKQYSTIRWTIRLTKLWGKLAASHDVEMDAEDALASVGAVVHNHAVTVGKAELLGGVLRSEHQLAEQGFILEGDTIKQELEEHNPSRFGQKSSP